MTAPAYRILADDVDVTAAIAKHLVSLTITDKPGVEGDEFELVISDARGTIALPRRGALIRPSIGWRGQPLIAKGTYQVDEVEHRGPPDMIAIKGRAAQLQGPIKVQRELSYTGQTLGEILRTVAGRNGLAPAVDAGLAARQIAHVDQTNESDANFLTRLGRDYDAIATVKDGRLLFVPAGSGTSASGARLPTLRLTRRSGISHSFTISDREGGDTGVKAQYRDLDAAETKTAVAGDETGPVTTLRPVYPTEGEAAAAATAAHTRAKRGQRELRLTLDRGRPELIAGQPLRVSGWRAEIDDVEWVTEDVTHTLTESDGLHTTLTAKG